MRVRNVVVLGTGFAAWSFLSRIDLRLHSVVVVSPRNHFLFTPLLPSTTVGTVEFRSIIESIHSLPSGIRYIEAACESVDPARNSVRCSPASGSAPFDLPFELLVIAVGSVSNTFGVPGVNEHALFLRELSDAREIRRRVIDAMERAGMPGVSGEEKRRLLHFVVVGGGPTGVELAAEIHDLLADELAKAFPVLSQEARITLLEAGGSILTTFDASLGSYTLRHFKRQHIEVRTNAFVSKVEPDAVVLKDGERIPAGLVVWSTGIGPSPLVRNSSFPRTPSGRFIVDGYLRLGGEQDIFALGDCATPESKNLPATAQVAQQEGYYLARQFNRTATGKGIQPFKHRNLGMLAYIGENEALADLNAVKAHGFTAWVFWRSAYLTRLVSLKNKILVAFDWTKAILFGRDLSRF